MDQQGVRARDVELMIAIEYVARLRSWDGGQDEHKVQICGMILFALVKNLFT